MKKKTVKKATQSKPNYIGWALLSASGSMTYHGSEPTPDDARQFAEDFGLDSEEEIEVVRLDRIKFYRMRWTEER